MKKFYIVAMLLIVAGCETTPQLSSLQRRGFESKDLEGKYEDAFKSTLQVLQDYGYIIKSADYQSGVIQGETGLKKRNDFFGDSLLVNFEITATIEQFGENKVKERLSLIKKSKYMVGEKPSQIIEDPELFQRIYDDIQKEMFVRENLNK